MCLTCDRWAGPVAVAEAARDLCLSLWAVEARRVAKETAANNCTHVLAKISRRPRKASVTVHEVRRLDAKVESQQAGSFKSGTELTKESMDQLNYMYNKVTSLDQVCAGCDAIVSRVNCAPMTLRRRRVPYSPTSSGGSMPSMSASWR